MLGNTAGVVPIDTSNTASATGTSIPTSTPNGASSAGGNVGSVEQLLAQLLKSQAVQRQQVMLPQQVPPAQIKAGDVSGNFVNPSTIGGPKHNAKVTMAQSIGNAVAQVQNQAEQKKARDVVYDVARLEAAMNNPTPENVALANEILTDPKRAKEIQEALNLPGNLLGNAGKPDKTPPYIKQARQLIFGGGGGSGNNTGVNSQGQLPGQQQPIMQGGGQAQYNAQQAQQSGTQIPTLNSVPNPNGSGQVSPTGGGSSSAPQSIQGQANTPIAKLMHQMPTTLQLSPEAMVNAEAIKLGLTPNADKQIDFLKQAAKNDTDWQITEAQLKEKYKEINQKEWDSFRKAVTSEDRTQALQDIAKIAAKAKVSAAQLVADASEYRSDVIKANAIASQSTKLLIDTNKVQTDTITKEIAAQKDIIKSKDADSKAKKAASAQLTDLQKQADDLKKNAKELQDQYKGLQSGGNANVGSSTDTPVDSEAQHLSNLSNLLSDED